MTEQLHLSPTHRAVIEALLREHLPGVEVWAYGSRVNGRSHGGSDLDLVLRGPGLEEIPLGELGDFEEAVRDSSIPFLVEARDWAWLPERFHREIGRGYVVLVELPICVSNWRTLSLGECIVMNEATYSPKEAWPFVNYLDTGSITENRIDVVQNLEFGKDKLPSRARRKVEPGDIVFSTVRPNQKHFGLLRELPDNFLASTGFAVFRGKEGFADTGFIYWLLTQDHIIERLHTIAEHSTSAYPSIRPADIKGMEITLPPLSEQRAIAHVLGTLDDKIELNRQMNTTLEAMARALFKSWFVDFDPVRAKMEGRDTGLPWKIADLFPDRLVESDLGEIPDGWKIGCLSDIATSPRRGTNPAETGANTPYIGLEHMPRHSIALAEWEGAGKVTSNKFAFDKNEFLFGKLRPYFHKVGMAPVAGVCSTDIVVVGAGAAVWSAFVLAVISSSEFVAYTDQTSTGTKMPRTSWKAMSQYPLCLPAEPIVRIYQRIVAQILDLIVVNVHRNRSLAALRDTLLPKLISGEIRVADAEQVMEALV